MSFVWGVGCHRPTSRGDDGCRRAWPIGEPTMSDSALVADVDARCHCSRCTDPRWFVMLHHCSNCNSGFTAQHRYGDKARSGCPCCGAHWVNTWAKERVETGADRE